MKCPIRSVSPIIGNIDIIKDLNRTVYCIDHGNNAKHAANIMWTPMQVKNSRPCHFVPLLKVVRDYEQYIKYVKCQFLLFRPVKLPAITKVVLNTCKTSLEDNTAVADDNLDENAVKPLVVPDQIPENQAGSGLCSVDMEVMSLRPVVKWQPTAR